MAYSDYGAFVYLNGERRTDKEDVGVYDTDEASLPSGIRVYANIMKHHDGFEWFEFSHQISNLQGFGDKCLVNINNVTYMEVVDEYERREVDE